MLKRLAPFFFVVTLTGCPYTEGCQALDAPFSALDPSDPEPANEDTNGESEAPTSPTPTEATGKGAPMDFGSEPTGGPALSTLSCPELSMPSSAATIYVDVNATTGATRLETGSKNAPFRTLAKAFAAAQVKGVLYVAAGTYKENVTIPNKDLVVFGGFAPNFASRSNACATILESANVSLPVLNGPGDVKSFGIEGVTVQKAARGLLVTGDSTIKAHYTVARSVFTENGQRGEVGGAIAIDGVNARIFRSVFRNNQAAKGAALAVGGEVSVTIDQNLFEKNLGYSDHGGGLYINTKATKISRNTFRGNATGVGINNGLGGGWGGAVIVYSNSLGQPAKADFSFNVFTENTAGIGGAVFVDEGATIAMSHDLIYRNRAYPENGYLRGAAIYVDGTGYPDGGSTFTGEYLTVVNNIYDDKGVARPTSYGGNVYVEGYSKATFTNSIFWNNGDHEFYVEKNNELTVNTTVGLNACTSSGEGGLAPADATICKVAASVFKPEAIYFGDEAADDYHEMSKNGRFSKGSWVKDSVTSPAIGLGAYAKTPEASKPL